MTIKQLAKKVISMSKNRHVSVWLTINRYSFEDKDYAEVEYHIYDEKISDVFVAKTPTRVLKMYKSALEINKLPYQKGRGIEGIKDVSHKELKGVSG